MNPVSWDRLKRIERFLWAAALVALPVTSFRFLPFMGTDTQVRPLSLIPAALLLLVLIFRSIRERRLILWSGNFQPLLVFILVAIMSSALGFFLAPVDLYSNSYSGRVLRAWLSFGVGLVFLITSMCMNRDEQDLRFTLKWMYVGLIPELAWSLLQVSHIYIQRLIPLDMIQRTVLMAGLPPNGRISGLALEPSWLAAQVMTLYLPWAFASLLKKYNFLNRRWLAVVILMVCAFLLTFTFSRAGILIAIGSVVLTFFIAGRERIIQAWQWLLSPLRWQHFSRSRLLDVSLRLAVIITLVAGLAGGAFILSRNRYFAQIWQSRENTLTDYFVDIYAGPRLAYAWAGWTVFEQHPWSGVGLGAAGLYLTQAFPDWSHFNNPDIAQLLSPDNRIYPNTKNLYIRLFSETGILGFWSFMAVYLLALGKILRLLRSKRRELVFLGTASLFAWLSIVMLGLTQDSLAMPITWLPLGILFGMVSKDL